MQKNPGQKVIVFLEKDSPRLRYTFKVLLEVILEWEVEFRTGAFSQPAPFPSLSYGLRPVPGTVWLGADPRFDWRDKAGIYSLENWKKTGFDRVAGAFSLLSFAEYRQNPVFDPLGRYRHEQYFPFAGGDADVPVVQVWAMEIAASLQTAFPEAGLTLPGPRPAMFTVDVDFPWKYLHRPPLVHLGGMAKDLLRGDFSRLRERLGVYFSRKDPYFTFETLSSLLPPAQSRFFFLIERRHALDGRATWRLPALQRVVNEMLAKGFSCGVHPSFSTMDRPDWLLEELALFSGMSGRLVQQSRQHYLRFRIPDTWAVLAQTGIAAEYSLCPITRTGFIGGMAKPYPWYDPDQDRETSLWLHPSQAMDRGMMKYEGMDARAACDRMRALHRQAQAHLGGVTILLHNDAWSESEEWRGWSKPLTELITDLCTAPAQDM